MCAASGTDCSRSTLEATMSIIELIKLVIGIWF